MNFGKYQSIILARTLLSISLLDPVIIISLSFYNYYTTNTPPMLDIAIISLLRSLISTLLFSPTKNNSLFVKIKTLSHPVFFLYCWTSSYLVQSPVILASTLFSLVEYMILLALVSTTIPTLPISTWNSDEDDHSPLLSRRDSIPSPSDFNQTLRFPQISLD
jgi:hypothetical protein